MSQSTKLRALLSLGELLKSRAAASAGGKATAADHELLLAFQVKTGKRLLREIP